MVRNIIQFLRLNRYYCHEQKYDSKPADVWTDTLYMMGDSYDLTSCTCMLLTVMCGAMTEEPPTRHLAGRLVRWWRHLRQRWGCRTTRSSTPWGWEREESGCQHPGEQRRATQNGPAATAEHQKLGNSHSQQRYSRLTRCSKQHTQQNPQPPPRAVWGRWEWQLQWWRTRQRRTTTSNNETTRESR